MNINNSLHHKDRYIEYYYFVTHIQVNIMYIIVTVKYKFDSLLHSNNNMCHLDMVYLSMDRCIMCIIGRRMVGIGCIMGMVCMWRSVGCM